MKNILKEFLEGKLEKRGYQFWIINAILQARSNGKNVIIELDAGMGKRIIAYLIARLFSSEKILIITPSRASVWDMVSTFRELSNSDSWFGVVIGGLPRGLKLRNLEKRRVIIATPISLARIMEHRPEIAKKIDIVIINEVDKVIRRVPSWRNINMIRHMQNYGPEDDNTMILSYPWNILKRYLPEDACWIGMSGTLRDEHYLVSEDGIRVQKELDTIARALYPRKPLVIISMDKLIERTDAREYIVKNLTVMHPVPVSDPKIKILVDCITKEIDDVVQKIAEYNKGLYPGEQTPFDTKEKIHRTISVLPDSNPLKIKFLRLALARRHIFASIPSVYRRFISKPMFRRIVMKYSGRRLEELIPEDSAKVNRIIDVCRRWMEVSKSNIIIVTSFIRTAVYIWRRLKEGLKIEVLLLTGRTYNKRAVIEEFRKRKPCILILTPVAERDLDFPEAELVIIHDVISTVKSMYQRIKRARRSRVLVLYYADTFEEKKVHVLLSRMARRYPWSIRIMSPYKK